MLVLEVLPLVAVMVSLVQALVTVRLPVQTPPVKAVVVAGATVPDRSERVAVPVKAVTGLPPASMARMVTEKGVPEAWPLMVSKTK